MKCNKFTAALVALGLVSAASVASASTLSSATPVTIGGTSYTAVYVTGSTAYGGSTLLAALKTVFKPGYTVQGSGNDYNIYGALANNTGNYLVSVDLTGSEAGLWALENQANGAPNVNGNILPGTPLPTTYVDPNSSNTNAALTAIPDLALADTSFAVSLSKNAGLSALTDYGIVAVIPFGWFKGSDSAGATSSDTSWADLVNVSSDQLSYEVTAPFQASPFEGGFAAAYFTGNFNDGDNVYLIGRNKGSGTRVNTLLDLNKSITGSINQYAAANAKYVSGVLTYESTANLSTAGGLQYVGNDGFDAGSGVVNTLLLDASGVTDGSGSQVVLIGYVGISSLTSTNSTTLGGTSQLLSLDGVTESDGTIVAGTYSFWGHEHLYGQSTPTTAGTAIADLLAGTGKNEVLGGGAFGGNPTTGGAIEALYQGNAQEYGNEENETTGAAAALLGTRSPSLDPAAVYADKPSDAGYPSL